MKKDKNLPVSKDIKSVPGSDPINKFKKDSKGATVATVNNIITGAVESVKQRTNLVDGRFRFKWNSKLFI